MDLSLFLAATTAGEPGLLISILGTLQSLLYVAVGLGFVIFVHELGHFLVAKACGVKCEKFYVGFDFLEIPIPFTPWKIPRALWKMQIGETEYGIGSLPLGGYVKMLGQDDDPRNAEAEAERTKATAAARPHVAENQHGEGLTLGSTIEKVGEAVAHTPSADRVKNADPPGQPAVAAKTADGKTVLLDPRSYTAKSVPARMAIISAGVIMNAIFAVVFATIAYKMGVPEVPAGIGGVTPGEAAWQAGMEPGEKIIAFGDAPVYEWLRHEDLKRNVILNGRNNELKMKVRNLAGSEKTYEIRPALRDGNKFPTVGLLTPRTTEIAVPKPEEAKKRGLERLLPKTNVPIKTKDRVIAVDGQQITSGPQLSALLVQRPRGPLQLTIEREENRPEGADPRSKAPTSTHDITLQETPALDLGVVLKMGPVSAVRKGSPAEAAGILVGDRIESIDGQPVKDPVWLGQELLDRVGKTIAIVVKRADKDGKFTTKELTATLEAPRNLFSIGDYDIGGFAAAEPLGIAYELTPTVAEVTPGTMAATQGLKPGDRLLSAWFEQPEREKPDELDKFVANSKSPKNRYDLANKPDQWLKVLGRVQDLKPDVRVRLEFKRGDAIYSVLAEPVPSETHFDDGRHIHQLMEIREHIAKDWSEAFWLGRRETKERIQEVLLVLHRLVTGQLSPTNLSGPPGILTAATQVASNGIPLMLIFLTMLSANLAVINFLPIPVLDGGHMMFLAAEWIRGRPVDAELQTKLTVMGLVFLLGLMVFASAMDIGRFFYG